MKIFYKLTLILIGSYFLFNIYEIIRGTNSRTFSEIFDRIDGIKVVVCLLMYLLSHFIRVLRIAVMIGRQNFSLVSLLKIQYYTNAVNLLVPFKLGEFYRILEFNKVIQDKEKTFFTIIAERGIDFILIFLGLFICVYFTEQTFIEIKTTIFIGTVFIGSILFTFFVLPQNLRFLNIFLAKRHTSKRIVKVLYLSSKIHDSIEGIRNIVTKEKATLLILSLCIWMLEIGSFYYINDFSFHFKYTVLLACFVFLSGIIPSGSLGLGGIQLAFYLVFRNIGTDMYLYLSISYQLFIFLPAVLIGITVLLSKSSVWGRLKPRIL